MKPTGKEIPCRLFAILATEAPVGVIFRRGPSKWVQIIKWNTNTDTFEFGQWFHGRIYEDRSDLSPDGTKLLYMATKYTNRDESIGQVWTAVSKLPYLTALALFAHKSSGTWQGGGLFVSNDEVWIDAEPAPGTNTFFPHKDHRPAGLKVTAYPADDDVLSFRLKRDGWKNQEKAHPTKPISLHILSLTDVSSGHSFTLKDKEQKREIPLSGVVWADWDKRGRLLYAKDGKLFTGALDATGELRSEEITDFNMNKPEPKETPDWAKTW